MKAARLPAFLLALATMVALMPALLAQSPSPPVTWSVALEPRGTSSVAAGGTITVAVTAKISEGWHVYGTDELKDGPRPLTVTLPAGQPFKAGTLQAPEPERDFDASFNQVTTFYPKATTFRVPVTVSTDARRGPASINVEVGFQACDGRVCLPGRAVKMSAAVAIR